MALLHHIIVNEDLRGRDEGDGESHGRVIRIKLVARRAVGRSLCEGLRSYGVDDLLF